MIWKGEATRKQLAEKGAEVKSASEKLQAAEVIPGKNPWGAFFFNWK
jgi:hypothetical protein